MLSFLHCAQHHLLAPRPLMTALPSVGTLSRVLLAPLLSDMRRFNHLANSLPGTGNHAGSLSPYRISNVRFATSHVDTWPQRARRCAYVKSSRSSKVSVQCPRWGPHDFRGSKPEATPYPSQHLCLSQFGSVSCCTFKLSPFAGLSPLSFSPWDFSHPIAERCFRPVPHVAV